jgi:hypothetical protein
MFFSINSIFLKFGHSTVVGLLAIPFFSGFRAFPGCWIFSYKTGEVLGTPGEFGPPNRLRKLLK